MRLVAVSTWWIESSSANQMHDAPHAGLATSTASSSAAPLRIVVIPSPLRGVWAHRRCGVPTPDGRRDCPSAERVPELLQLRQRELAFLRADHREAMARKDAAV